MTLLEIVLLTFVLGTFINYTIKHIVMKTHKWHSPIFYVLSGIPLFPLVIYLIQKRFIIKKIEVDIDEEELAELLDEFNKAQTNLQNKFKERKKKNDK